MRPALTEYTTHSTLQISINDLEYPHEYMSIYSTDLRECAAKYLLDGHTYAETADVFHVCFASLVKWKKKFKEQGNCGGKPRKQYFKKIDPQKLTEYLEKYPDAYQCEIAQFFNCSIKKECDFQKQDSLKVLEFKEKIKDFPSDKIVYLDETGIDRYFYRSRAWSPRGVPVFGKISGRRYRRLDIVDNSSSQNLSPKGYTANLQCRYK